MPDCRHAVLAIAVCFLPACGTIHNLDGRQYPVMSITGEVRPRAFGGVARDLEWTSSGYWPVKPFFVLDIPVSLVADVVTLPEIRGRQAEWDMRHKDRSVSPDCPTPGVAPASD